MNRLAFGLIIGWLIGLTIGLCFAIPYNTQLSDKQIDERIKQQLDEREQKLVAHYLPRVHRIQRDFGLKQTEPKTIIELIDALSGVVNQPSEPAEQIDPTKSDTNSDTQPTSEPSL